MGGFARISAGREEQKLKDCHRGVTHLERVDPMPLFADQSGSQPVP